MSARDDVLGALRAALSDVPAGEVPADVSVPRGYRRGGASAAGPPLDLLCERIADYRASVRRVPADQVREAVAAACAARGARRLAVPDDLPDAWLPRGVELVVDSGLGARALDALDGALTGCEVAIAETGTLVLAGGPGQGRRIISLVPDYHLCIVEAERVVASVPEAFARLAAAVAAGRPLTFVSGPSATSDIELRRVEGVHGPRTLEVLVVEAR